jgi:hypothetical protein
MHTIVTKALGILVLIVLFATIPMACGDSDSSGNRPRKETMIGGSKGVVVEHGGGEGAEVKIGGDKGVVVNHH